MDESEASLKNPPSDAGDAPSEIAEDAKVADPSQDDELNALLDSALSDFDKPVKRRDDSAARQPQTSDNANSASVQSGAGISSSTSQVQAPPSGSDDSRWGAEFAQFESALQSFLAEDPQLKEQWDRLTESAAKAASASSDEEFASSLADTLKGLADNAQAIAEGTSEDDVSRLLGSMGLSDGIGSSDLNGALPDLLPLMQNVMQNLLSKDLLYPALKDMVDKYPDWLTQQKGALSTEEYDRYNRQFGLMKQVCQEFEEENKDDPEDVKKARFERVIVIMQKMQDCGNPPKELLGDMGGEVEFDENGRLRLPGMTPENQCNIM